ncbi:hypothetical protein AB0I28_02295 [Phytomonospora sp. NPDC050363]|uniref:hypothetical protein n=1 Tax=Phytomonospora sp. NPDC050363 TaxID=3155642 RepID=UPI0033CA9181
MIRYRLTVPGTCFQLDVARAEDGRLLELRCGERVHARWDGEALHLGDGLARIASRPHADGFSRTVETPTARWTENYRWDGDERLVHVDGMEIRRDEQGRVTACVDAGRVWRYGYAGRDLAVIDTPDGPRHLTAAEDGRPVGVRVQGARRRLDYGPDGARPAAVPGSWHHDEAGRLWTVIGEDGRVEATYLWDGAACLGRVDGPPDRPLSTVYSLDPSGTPVRLIRHDEAVRVPRDAFGESLLAHDGAPGLFGGAVHSGFVHLPARTLDPRTGSFCAADPFHGGGDDPRRSEGYRGDLPIETGAAGPYAICRHDPVGRTDPTGAISWWLPLSDFTWGLQNNIVSLLGLDFTVNWWGSLFSGQPGRFFHFDGVSTSDRIGAYALRRDGVFSGSRAFTFAHTMFVNDEGLRRVTNAELFHPTAAFSPTYYGSVLRMARTGAEGPPPLLLAGDSSLPASPLTWGRGGGPATAAIPGTPATVFPEGGLFFTQPGDMPWRAGTDATLTELFPAGTPAQGAFTAGTLSAAITGAAGLAAARTEQYGVADLAALVAATPRETFAGGTVNGTVVSFTGVDPGDVRPGQTVLFDGVPEVVTTVTVTCEFDRALTGLTGTLTLSQVATTGLAYDATLLPDGSLAVAPTTTAGGIRTQFPRFTAGNLVQVAWASATQPGPDEFAVAAADGGHLTLTGGRAPLPGDATGITVTLLTPLAAPGGSVAQGRAGALVAGATATFDLWRADQSTAWTGANTMLAVSDATASRPVRMAAAATPPVPPDWSLTLAAAPAVTAPVTIVVPPAPTSTQYYATVTTIGATTSLADPDTRGTEPTGGNLVIATGFAPGATPVAAGRAESAASRVAEAEEDFETDKFQGLMDHELMHTVQSQRLGPWLLACFPLGLFELGRIAPALRDFDMPDYSAFGSATLAAAEPGRRILTIGDAAGVGYGSGDDVQIWNAGQQSVVKLGEVSGAGGFVVNVSGVGPDGPVSIRKVNTGTGLTWYRSFYNAISLLTHTGMMNLVAGTIWGGLFFLIGRGVEAIDRAFNEITSPAEFDGTDELVLRLRPTGSDTQKENTIGHFRGARRILIKQNDNSLLREIADASGSPLLRLATPTALSGDVTVSLDTTQGSVWDGYDYYPVSVPDGTSPGTVKVEPAGSKTLTLHIHDRVAVEFADANGSNSNSVTTYVSHVRPDGLVELENPPFLDGRPAAIGRIAKIASTDGAGWWDSWLMERMGMGWMRWIFDPYGQLTLRTNPEHNSAGEIVGRVFRYLIGGKSWSMVPPVFGYFWWDNLFNQPSNGYRSKMEQEASQESGRLYSAEGRLRIAPAVVGDVGRYWFFVTSNQDPLLIGSQDEPGVTVPQVPTVMPQVTAETSGTVPPFNKDASGGPRTAVPGAPDDPGGCVPDVFFDKTPAGEPTGPARSFQFTDRGAIPVGPATAYSVGMHTAFCRPGKHRITLANGFTDGDSETKARDAQDRDLQRVYYEPTIADVAVTLGGIPVAEGATVRLLAGQRAPLVVTPGGAGRKHALTVVRPADGPVRTADDGDTLIAAAAVTGAPAEITRRYRPGADGLHTDGGLAGRRVHLGGDVHIPVRVFSVDVSTTLILRSAAAFDPADPESNAVTTLHPGQPVFLVLPVTTTGAPTVSPAGAVNMTVTPVSPVPAALTAFVGDGTVLELSFEAPTATTPFTIGVPAAIPGAPAEPPVPLVTGALTLETT